MRNKSAELGPYLLAFLIRGDQIFGGIGSAVTPAHVHQAKQWRPLHIGAQEATCHEACSFQQVPAFSK